MKNKFKFLTKDSLKKKICTKSFLIVNIVIFLITVCLINLDSVVKLFGGDFDKEINVYVIDEVGIYDDLEETMKTGYKDILNNYNASLTKTDKSIDELKEEIIKDKDILIKEHNVNHISIFGSISKNKERIDSDIDLLVSFSLDATSDEIKNSIDFIKERYKDRFHRFIDVMEIKMHLTDEIRLETQYAKEVF